MTHDEISALADAWIAHWYKPEGSDERRLSRAADLHDLEHYEPETLWSLILAIHRKDQSVVILQVLSAGPIEELLVYR